MRTRAMVGLGVGLWRVHLPAAEYAIVEVGPEPLARESRKEKDMVQEPEPLPRLPSIRETRTTVLRVYSVKRNADGLSWEVRADDNDGPAVGSYSLFYREVDPDNLPRLNSLLDVTIKGIISD